MRRRPSSTSSPRSRRRSTARPRWRSTRRRSRGTSGTRARRRSRSSTRRLSSTWPSWGRRARAHRAASNRRKPRPRPGGGAAGRRRRPRAWGMAHGAREEPAAATHPPPARVAGASLGGVLCAPQPRDAPRDCTGVPPALRRRSGGGGPGVAGRRRPLEGDQAAHSPRLAGAGRRGEAGEAGEGAGGAPPPAAAASRSLHHPVSAPFRGTQTPGLLEAQLLLARSRYLGGEFDEALRCCAACAKARAPRCARIRDGWRPPSPGR